MTTRFRRRGPDYWTPLVRLTEALTMLEMALLQDPVEHRNDVIRGMVRDLGVIREALLRAAQHPTRSRATPTKKGDPT